MRHLDSLFPRARYNRGMKKLVLSGYLGSLGLVVAATALGLSLRDEVEPTNLVMVFLAAVVVSAIFLGFGPSIFASVAGMLAFDFFCVEPYLSLAVKDTDYALTFAGLLGVGLVISSLTARLRLQIELSRRRENETSTLYHFSSEMNAAIGSDAIADVLIRSVLETVGCESMVLVPSPEGKPGFDAHPRAASLSGKELSAAQQAFSMNRRTGFGTETLPQSEWRFVPLKAHSGVVGVLAAKVSKPPAPLTQEQERVLEAFASVTALSIERWSLARQAAEVRILKAKEDLQTALLNSVSHELRTPLTTIVGVLSSLAESDESPNLGSIQPASQAELIQAAKEEADRLNVLVSNLLDMSRIESRALKVNRKLEDIEDVIGSAVIQARRKAGNRRIVTGIPRGLPLVDLDYILISQACGNLLDNALKYSPADTNVEVTAWVEVDSLLISIADRGPGIPEEDLGRIFTKFYRVQRPERVPGTGLGLAITKGFVEAHGGKVWAENRQGGGVVFTMSLPLQGSKEGPR